MKIIFVGDIVGKSGREAIEKKLPIINKKFNPDLVYVSKIKLARKNYFGITNAGYKPTFGNHIFTVETFIFEFENDIYGEYLEVIPLHQLRPETKFLGMEDLKKQIMKDVNSAQKYLISNNLSSKNS